MSTWPDVPTQWTSQDYKLQLISESNNVTPTPIISVNEVIEASSSFPIKFPIDSVRCNELLKQTASEILENNINSTYPVIHEYALYLCSLFLSHQKKFGNRDFYKDMSLIQLIDRLLCKRAVVFLGEADRYILLDGSKGKGSWESIGTSEEKPPLTLKNCLSYDEIKLSALLSVSSHTYFINDGTRKNRGVPAKDRSKIEDDGVIIGLIGTRLEKEKVMEYREIMKTKSQNNHHYGYGNFFVPTLQGLILNFYGDVSLTYDQLLPQLQTNTDRYFEIEDDVYFDALMFERRIVLSIDTLLVEANDRAKKLGKTAFVHVVGLGLGVWKIWDEQNQMFMDTFAKRLEFLGPTLADTTDVCFAYIHCNTAGSYKNGEKIGNIKIHMIDRDPHSKLEGEFKDKFLVVSYAWDGNALPGNEFWTGSLSGSGDPAAAASTQVAELHNWHINKKVSANNLRVATVDKGLVTFAEFQSLHKDD